MSLTKKPSNTSTQGGIVSHSRRSQSNSDHYHSKVVTPTVVKPSRMKMTRAEHLISNDEDWSEKGHKL